LENYVSLRRAHDMMGKYYPFLKRLEEQSSIFILHDVWPFGHFLVSLFFFSTPVGVQVQRRWHPDESERRKRR
jgi:hypothetical protein